MSQAGSSGYLASFQRSVGRRGHFKFVSLFFPDVSSRSSSLCSFSFSLYTVYSTNAPRDDDDKQKDSKDKNDHNKNDETYDKSTENAFQNHM